MVNNITFNRKAGFYYLRVPVNMKSTWIYYLNILAHSKSIRDAVYNTILNFYFFLIILETFFEYLFYNKNNNHIVFSFQQHIYIFFNCSCYFLHFMSMQFRKAGVINHVASLYGYGDNLTFFFGCITLYI